MAAVLGILLLVSVPLAHAAEHSGPPVTQPVYSDYTYPVPTRYAHLPRGCSHFLANIFWGCSRSAKLELTLEREFWAHVQNTNFNGMSALLSKIKNYVYYSNTPYQGRLVRLMAFGNVMLSQKVRGLVPEKVPNLIAARALGELSNIKQPEHAFTHAITGFTDILLSYALLQGRAGDNKVEFLLDSPRTKGEYGLEAAAVGAMALSYTTDTNRIYRGLAILNDCVDPICTRTSSVAPFKLVGMKLSVAEAYVAVGDRAGAQRMVNEAIEFAKANNMAATPLKELEGFGAEILGDEFMTASRKLTGFGMYRLPAGPSQDAKACAMCHQNAVVPDYYYNWK